MQCEVEGRPGLVLVEAKANVPELSRAGKSRGRSARSPRSADSVRRGSENHDRIGIAIADAYTGLSVPIPGIRISRDTHFQLSNRLAFGWKLASMGIPTVLVYLGFTGDEGIREVGEPFADDAHWQREFRAHLTGVCPAIALDRPLDVSGCSFWLLSRSKPRLENSPPRPERKKSPANDG